MGVIVHRVISVTGSPADVQKALRFVSNVAAGDVICFIGPVFQQINETDTFCVHSSGSKAGHEEARACNTLMDRFAAWLGNKGDGIQFVDVSYSADRFRDQGPFTIINNATYKNREDEDASCY